MIYFVSDEGVKEIWELFEVETGGVKKDIMLEGGLLREIAL